MHLHWKTNVEVCVCYACIYTYIYICTHNTIIIHTCIYNVKQMLNDSYVIYVYIYKHITHKYVINIYIHIYIYIYNVKQMLNYLLVCLYIYIYTHNIIIIHKCICNAKHMLNDVCVMCVYIYIYIYIYV